MAAERPDYVVPYFTPTAENEADVEDYQQSSRRVGSALAGGAAAAYWTVPSYEVYNVGSVVDARAFLPNDGGRAVNLEKWTSQQVAEYLRGTTGVSDATVDLFEMMVEGGMFAELDADMLAEEPFNLKKFESRVVLRKRDDLKRFALIEGGVAERFGILAGDVHQLDVPVIEFAQLSKPLEKIGAGAYGDVFRTIFTSANGGSRDTVLKKPKPGTTAKGSQPEVQKRSEELAETLCMATLRASGRHANVVTLMGVCDDVPGAAGPCLVLSYHANGPLGAYLEAHADTLREEWRADPERLFELLLGVAQGLAFVHAHGFVHGDIKADNVFVTTAGVPRLGDFGKARRLGGSWSAGTGFWLVRFPPECFVRHGHPFDCSGDVWMLGLLYLDVLRRAVREPFVVDPERMSSSLTEAMKAELASGRRVAQVGIDEAVASVFDEDSNEFVLLVRVIRECLVLREKERLKDGAAVVAELERAWAQKQEMEAEQEEREREVRAHRERTREQLKEFEFSNEKVKRAVLGLLDHESKTTELNLSSSGVTDGDLTAIAAALRDDNVVTVVELSYNSIVHVAPLIEALCVNSTLRHLYLKGNDIVDVARLAEALRAKSTLATLHLGNNKIVDVTQLAEALRVNSTLTKIYLSGNEIVDVAPLVDALRVNSTLTFLSLSRTDIVDVAPLAEALRVNSTLKHLYLHKNKIVDVTPLAEALRTNSTLITLRLTDNPISSESQAAIRAAWNNRSSNLYI